MKSPKKASKLLAQMRLLTPAEIRDFKVFMEMPSNKLSKRDCFLGGAFADWVQDSGEDEDAFWKSSLQPKEKKNKKRISNRLVRALDRFLGLRELEQEEGVNHLLLFRLFRQYNLEKSENYQRKQLETHLDQAQNYTLIPPSVTEYFKRIADTRLTMSEKEPEVYYQRILDQLSHFYVEQRLYMLFAQAASSMVVNGASEQVEEAKRKFKDGLEQAEHPVKNIFEELYQLIFEDQSSAMSGIIHSLGEYPKHIAEDVKIIVINYCVKKYNTGNKEFGVFLMEFMEKEWEDAKDKKRPFTIWSLKTLMTACIMVGAVDKALYYIDEIGRKVEPIKGVSTKHMLYLYRAHAHFAAGRLDESHDCLNRFQQSKTYNKIKLERIESDKLLFKIYYERRDYGPMLDLVRKTKKYVEKHAAEEPMLKQKYGGFFLYAEKLCKEGVGGLENEDLSRLPVVDRQWFQRVIDRGSSSGL
ncbi:MAG: hypothetical protein GVY26_10750 [Bacteroidetes bacterium]|jgi:hypothetical protein|nr:hypothetical protein [Bacteroidota bacterium]